MPKTSQVDVKVSTVETGIRDDNEADAGQETPNQHIHKAKMKGKGHLSILYKHFVWSLIIATGLYLVLGMFIFSLIEGDNAEGLKVNMKTTEEFARDYLGKTINAGSYLSRVPSDQTPIPSASFTIETTGISLTEWTKLVRYTT